MTIHVKHAFRAVFGCFSPHWGVGWGWGGGGGAAPKGLVHNQLMQLFTLGSSKTRIFQNLFFLIW